MNSYITVKKGAGSDRQAIQDAINLAKEQDTGTVVVEAGEWILDGSLYLYDSIHLILDGAILRLANCTDGIIIRNSHSVEAFCNRVAAAQQYITISGKNGAALVGGTISLTNVSYSIIEGLGFVQADNFAVILASTMAVKVRNCTFSDCDNAIAVGVGARDSMFMDLKGDVKHCFFVFGDFLYEEFRRNHRDHIVYHHIIRNVSAKAERFAYLYGDHVESIVFNDIFADVTKVAFDVKRGKHICISNAQVQGKLLNDDVEKHSVYIDEEMR